MNSILVRRKTHISNFLVAILIAASVSVGVIGVAAERADAAVTYSQHPIAGWSTNGPVYAVKIVGDRVYVGGYFNQVRGPGGSPVVTRNNLFAIDRNTGALITGFVANANSPVDVIDSDGTNVFVGGRFTTVNGAARRFLASVDPATGAVRPAFNPNPQNYVLAMAVRGDSLYLGGRFTNIGGVPRNRIAIVDRTTGALDPTFNPNANEAVQALHLSPNGARLYVGGDFTAIAGATQSYLVALDSVTGARIPVVYGQFNAPLLDLDVDPDGSRVYAAAAGFPGDGNRAIAWNAATGTRIWRQESDGDVQAIEYSSGEVYFGFHEGFGGNVLRHIQASDAVTGAIDANFQPNVNSFWGVWSIDASAGTLAVGGEFTNFDGVAVQGIALLPSIFAGDTTPPTTPTNLVSTSHTSSTVSLSWSPSTDNTQVAGYAISRDGVQIGVSQTTTFTDQDLAPSAEHTYTVRAFDGIDNSSPSSDPVTVRTSLPVVLAGSTWRYLDNGSNQGTAWQANGFVDSTWASGSAQLGYGDGDEATLVSFGPNANLKHRTTYFRRTFDVANPATVQALNLRLLRDDGAAVYLNGTEVARSGMAAGAITSASLASVNTDGANEVTFFPFTVPPGLLVAGPNTIAVEVHQSSNASSDLSFDLALDAEVAGGGGDRTPPTAPSALTLGAVTADSVALSWQPSTDDTGVDQYIVRRDGVSIGTTAATDFVDATADDGQTYTYTVLARDAALNTSAASNAVVANTPDVTAPSAPSGLTAQSITESTVGLTWTAPVDNVGVHHYTVTRDLVEIGAPAAAAFNDSGLTQLTNYTYTVTATDAAGNTSGPTSLTVTTSGPSSTQTLIPARSAWRYLDNGSNQGTAWRGVGFNDSTWATGNGILGYGETGLGTTVGFGPNASQKYLTTYFRRTFNVANAAAVQSLALQLTRDDGAVVYINGVEVVRSNMPAGTITSGSFAAANVDPPNEQSFFNFTVPHNMLVNGVNTIAVEVHQAYRSSSDLDFDLALTSNT